MESERPILSEQMNQSGGSFELVLSGVILGLIGLYIDRKLGTTPLFVVSLTILGFVGSGISLYYRYKHQIAELQKEAQAIRGQIPS